MKKYVAIIIAILFLAIPFTMLGCINKTAEKTAIAIETSIEKTSAIKEIITETTIAPTETSVPDSNQSGKIVGDTDPQKGEYFVNATLKSIDVKNNKITVEQLINEPNEKVIPPEVTLSGDCKIIKVILERPDEKETVSEIILDSIKLGSEIGIIFKSDNTARAIIYQEIIEK